MIVAFTFPEQQGETGGCANADLDIIRVVQKNH